MERFSNKTIEKLQYYVYALIDPRDKKIFYIGKGKGYPRVTKFKDTEFRKGKS